MAPQTMAGMTGMDMSGTATSTMSGMDMSGSTTSMGGMATGTGMSGMSGSSSMMSMMSVFQNDRATPLYSMAWTPHSVGTYAGTCIFLIALGFLFRGMLAAKALQEAKWLDRELNRRYVNVQGRQPVGQKMSEDSIGGGGGIKKMTLTENGVEESVMVVEKTHTHRRPWRLSVDPVRAVIDTVIAGVGYLLMLAVMTMNVGYFLSVLGGVFCGSLAVGRYTHSGEH